ncbi:hypothetical protein HYT60_00350 [Candidatus Woesebacteria bacterium]|nr:hypothetical protein [Candidatus Woesebacteria bacterium]
MPIHNPPQYRYALFESWDKEAFDFIKQIGSQKNYPKITGAEDNKNKFLIVLIRTQKSLHDWRDFLKDMLTQIMHNGVIDTKSLNEKYPPESISKEKPAWVTYEEDKIVNNFIDELAIRKVKFVGTDEEIAEFAMRFLLGQLGHDWEWTIMMIWEMLGNENSINVKQLNEEMKNFDYLGLFK